MSSRSGISGIGALLALGLLTVACTSTNGSATGVAPTSTTAPPTTPSTTSTPPVLSPEADTYLREAISLMREWSINRDRVDWDAIEARAFTVANGAQSATDTYPAIKDAMRGLGDNHSVFFTASEAARFDDGPVSFDEPIVELGDDGIGYVAIGRFVGNVGDQADDFATALARRLDELMPEACGWILDLRQNTGGNMWPMIGGLAPLLGEGQAGSFTYPDGTTEPWTLADGIAYWDGVAMTTYGLEAIADPPPVAVLIGARTASSGEATTAAFHGRPDTRLFGLPTAGLTTSNEPLPLPDGALMMLTMSAFTDRTGHAFGQDIPIEPDQAIDGDPTPAATDWLLTQPTCGG